MGRDKEYARLETLFKTVKQDPCQSLVFIDGDNTTNAQRKWFRKPLYENLYQEYSITFIEMTPTMLMTEIVCHEIILKNQTLLTNAIADHATKNECRTMDEQQKNMLREHTKLEIQDEIQNIQTINTQFECPLPREYNNASFACIQVDFGDSGLLNPHEQSPPMDWSLDETYAVPYPSRSSLKLIGKRLFIRSQMMEWLEHMIQNQPNLRLPEA